MTRDPQLPTLGDFPNLVRIRDRRAQLTQRRQAIAAELRQQAAVTTNDGRLHAWAAALAEGDAVPGIHADADRTQALRDEARVVELAVAELERAEDAELSNASLGVCSAARPQHERLVAHLLDALRTLTEAVDAEIAFRQGIRDTGFSPLPLPAAIGDQCRRWLGSLDEAGALVRRLSREADSRGYKTPSLPPVPQRRNHTAGNGKG